MADTCLGARLEERAGKTLVLPPKAQVQAISVHLLDDEAAEARAAFTYDPAAKPNTPGYNAVCDLRLGTTRPNYLCSTCGENGDACPGHFGLWRLAAPVFAGVFVPHLPKILNCICYACSALLVELTDARAEKLLALDFRKRLKELSDTALRTQRVCRECGALQPREWVRQAEVVLRPLFALSDFEHESAVPCISPFTVRAALRGASPATSKLLGFKSHVRACVQSVILVPPNLMRPPSRKPGDDDLSQRLKWVFRADTKLRAALTPLAPEAYLAAMAAGDGVAWDAGAAAQSGNVARYALDVAPTAPRLAAAARALLQPQACACSLPAEEALQLDRRVNLSALVVEPFRAHKHSKVTQAHTLGELQHPTAAEVPPRCFCLPLPPPAAVPQHTKNRVPLLPPHLNEYADVARRVAGFQDSRLNPLWDKDYGKLPRDVRHCFNPEGSSKNGNVRNNLFAKRSNGNARGVLAPGDYLQPDEVGVPLVVCRTLVVEETVTPLNFSRMLQLVARGPRNYPGANFVSRGGERYELPRAPALRVGDVVHRHTAVGDWLLLNRQPTLTKGSFMAYKVRPHTEPTIHISLAVTEALNGDFDGDEVNLYSLVSTRARAEAAHLMAVEHHVVQDGALQVTPVQNVCLAFYLLSEHSAPLPRELLFQMLSAPADWDFVHRVLAALPQDAAGPDLLRALLPTYTTGLLPKRAMRAHILAAFRLGLWDGASLTRNLGYFMKLGAEYLALYPSSLSLRTCTSQVGMPAKAEHLLRAAHRLDTSEPDSPSKERTVLALLAAARDAAGAVHLADHEARRTPLYQIVASGARGEKVHVVQISAFVGQQLDAFAQRKEREVVHFSRVSALEARGFVRENFSDGLSAIAFFIHTQAGRKGLVDSNCNTKVLGYLSRKLAKCLEDVRLTYTNVLALASGALILVHPGFSTQCLRGEQLQLLAQTEAEIRSAHSYPPEVQRLLALRAQLFAARAHALRVASPVDLRALVEYTGRTVPPSGAGLDRARFAAAVAALYADLTAQYNLPKTPLFAAYYFEHLSTSALERAHVTSKNQAEDLLERVAYLLARSIEPPHAALGICASHNLVAPLTQGALDSAHFSGQTRKLVSGSELARNLFNHTKTKTPSVTAVLPAGEVWDDEFPLVEVVLADCLTGFRATPLPVDPARTAQFQRAAPHGPLAPHYLTFRLNRKFCTEQLVAPRSVALALHRELVRVLSCPQNKVRSPAAGQASSGTEDPEASDPDEDTLLCTGDDDVDVEEPEAAIGQGEEEEDEEGEEEDEEEEDEEEEEENGGPDAGGPTPEPPGNPNEDDCDDDYLPEDLPDEHQVHSLHPPPPKPGFCACPARGQLPVAYCTCPRPGTCAPRPCVHDVVYSDLRESTWWVSVNLDPSVDTLGLATALQSSKTVLRGVPNIKGYTKEKQSFLVRQNDVLVEVQREVLITTGSNLTGILALQRAGRPCFDPELTFTNDIRETLRELGIEAACACLQHQLLTAMAKDSTTASAHYIRVVARTMCRSGDVLPLSYSGMAKYTSNVKIATLERPLQSFLAGAMLGEHDELQGISEAILVGSQVPSGAGSNFDLLSADVLPPPQPKVPCAFPPQVYTPDLSDFLAPPGAPLAAAPPAGPAPTQAKRKALTMAFPQPKRPCPETSTSARVYVQYEDEIWHPTSP